MKHIDVDQSFSPAFMRRGVMRVACAAAAASVIGLAIFPSSAAETDWSKVAAALGKSGAVMPGEVYRVGILRTDLHVTLDGVELKPTLALGSWVTFEGAGSVTMVMGDLVLTESEVSTVMKQLLAGGIEITALHNHLLRAQPATFYMHVLGHGDPVKLTTALHEGLALSKTSLVNTPSPAVGAAPPKIDLDTAMIDQTLGGKGQIAGGFTRSTSAAPRRSRMAT